jgi:hypothetical protein
LSTIAYNIGAIVDKIKNRLREGETFEKVETFDDYMADDERVSFEEKKQILMATAHIKERLNKK